MVIRFLTMESPSPVPPYLSFVSASACLNELKISSTKEALMPIPVSLTLKRKLVLSPLTDMGSPNTSMLPLSVNFVALLKRFKKI